MTSVTACADWYRINALPRRTWTLAEAEDLAAQVTSLLRTPSGTMTLKPIQALALREAWEYRGLLGNLGVGCGKELLCLLLPRVLRTRVAVLIVAAGLDNVGRKAEMADYCLHWQIQMPRIIHFEELQTVAGKDLLDRLNPGLVIINEFQLFKDPHAARTRRMNRFVREHPQTVICALTGTPMKRSLLDFAHVARWVLGSRTFCPMQHDRLVEWADALDERLDMSDRIDPGVLLEMCDPDEISRYGQLNAARRGFQRRMADTPGVLVYSTDDTEVPSTIVVDELVLQASAEVRDAYRMLRTDWVLPDGTELVDGLEFARHARTLALGYWLKWRDPAPVEWMQARRAAASFIRAELKGSRRFDSPKEIEDAYPNALELTVWRRIKKDYIPKTVPVWISGEALAACREWLRGGGVAFTENRIFGEALANAASVPYFGAGGLNAAKQSIDMCRLPAVVASLPANYTGRNLQIAWSRMLVTTPLPNNLRTQQLLGRMQRIGQRADKVRVTMLTGCQEHRRAFWQSVRDAEANWHLTRNRQLLLEAEIKVEPAECPRIGWEWSK